MSKLSRLRIKALQADQRCFQILFERTNGLGTSTHDDLMKARAVMEAAINLYLETKTKLEKENNNG